MSGLCQRPLLRKPGRAGLRIDPGRRQPVLLLGQLSRFPCHANVIARHRLTPDKTLAAGISSVRPTIRRSSRSQAVIAGNLGPGFWRHANVIFWQCEAPDKSALARFLAPSREFCLGHLGSLRVYTSRCRRWLGLRLPGILKSMNNQATGDHDQSQNSANYSSPGVGFDLSSDLSHGGDEKKSDTRQHNYVCDWLVQQMLNQFVHIARSACSIGWEPFVPPPRN